MQVSGLTALLSALTVIFAVLVHHGIFHEVEWTHKESIGPFYVIYADHLGDYVQVGSAIDTVVASLPVSTCKTCLTKDRMI